MAYHIQIHPLVVEYILRPDVIVDDEARKRLGKRLIKDLGQNGDRYQSEAFRRVRPGSPCFWYDRYLYDDDQLKQ